MGAAGLDRGRTVGRLERTADRARIPTKHYITSELWRSCRAKNPLFGVALGSPSTDNSEKAVGLYADPALRLPDVDGWAGTIGGILLDSNPVRKRSEVNLFTVSLDFIFRLKIIENIWL